MIDPQDVLSYWFGPLQGPTDFPTDRSKLWWAGGADIDREIRERFSDAVEQALSGQLDAWLEQPRSALALVILLDQFTRNLGRGTPRAFAGDSAALKACQRGLQLGHDQQLRPIERGFLYMPLMHAESRDVARDSIARFEALSREIRSTCAPEHPDFLVHAQQHADIVQRFGRYPHRNEILGRESSQEERAFLEHGGPNFGQQKG